MTGRGSDNQSNVCAAAEAAAACCWIGGRTAGGDDGAADVEHIVKAARHSLSEPPQHRPPSGSQSEISAMFCCGGSRYDQRGGGRGRGRGADGDGGSNDDDNPTQHLVDTVFNLTYRCCLPCTRRIGWTEAAHEGKIIYKHELEQNGQPPWMQRHSATTATGQAGLLGRGGSECRPLLSDAQSSIGLSTPVIPVRNGSNCVKVSSRPSTSDIEEGGPTCSYKPDPVSSGKLGHQLLAKTPSTTSRRGSAVSAATEEALKAMTAQEHFELGYQIRRSIRRRLNIEKKPSTSGVGAVRGQLTFALRYDFIHRVLMVHVLNCQNLVPDHDSSGLTDPYVKMYLLPERRHHSKTKIHRRTVSPEFNEMFSFDVAYSALPNRMLQFNVFDFDRFTRHDLLGNIIMRDLFEKSDLYNWTEYTMQIISSSVGPEKNDFGDLLLYLSYSRPDHVLVVTVAKAYNLRPMDITGASDPYVKIEQVYQEQRVRKRRTSTKRANLNPVYHEILEFEMDDSQMEDTFLLVQVIDWDRIGKDDLLGCCVLGANSPTPEGRQQWRDAFLPPAQGVSVTSAPVGINHNLVISLDPATGTAGGSSVQPPPRGTNTRLTDVVSHQQQQPPPAATTTALPVEASTASSVVLVDASGASDPPAPPLVPDLTVTSGHVPPPPPPVVPGCATAGQAVRPMRHSVIIPKPRAIGKWHSLLPEIPDQFRHYNKK